MKFIILGSGGCTAIPRPLCKCKICKEAREKGKPYSRFGCSLFLDDLKLLVDTPEDIVHALNYAGIQQVNSVLFSHMDPDHTLGMRVFEHMRLDWLQISEGKECSNPIDVFAMEHVMSDVNSISSKFGSYLDYYENIRNIIKRKVVSNFVYLDDIKITFIKANLATVFVFEHGERRVIYAPCDVKPFPNNDIFKGADIMIIGNTIIGEILKDGFILKENSSLRDELFSMNEIEQLRNEYGIKKVIITHIEEDWGKSYDDYLELQKQYKDIVFAYDGMTFEV
ncbi:MBL fold metallo-hydrolase [Thermoanaerobacterium thermosaccharolyticum]|uniref:MBL fold metallo-hydrolase n=1 Tax=Thermoanaerobacterium thermosaccharolyticum TaxID=1517 RepID=UPI001783E2E7|nr:MBL fold metallo-hydrolase [Thermoanaerobacterium thermosaccharolyticum]MBE0068582.1 MBL fold metallo-hydrolase [Thermoanaerobacterium thermosaccharolyticum]MBE0228597.1 MBL fold metallo-hydrolase [Thermoanaerobacterium thermosaccharolyticum]